MKHEGSTTYPTMAMDLLYCKNKNSPMAMFSNCFLPSLYSPCEHQQKATESSSSLHCVPQIPSATPEPPPVIINKTWCQFPTIFRKEIPRTCSCKSVFPNLGKLNGNGHQLPEVSAMALLAVEFWELKSTDMEIAKVGKPWYKC